MCSIRRQQKAAKNPLSSNFLHRYYLIPAISSWQKHHRGRKDAELTSDKVKTQQT